jgi:ribosomal protein S18 acetylase RimI-like enzyme
MNFAEHVIALDPASSEHAAAAARLHSELLPRSPIPHLGFRFMTSFYYPKLVRSGLIHCALLRDENGYGGFVVYTRHPLTFMDEGFRGNPLQVGMLVALQVLRHPGVLKTLWKVQAMGRNRGSQAEDAGAGEILSIGVLPKYRELRDDATGLRASHYLFEKAALAMIDEGATALQIFVEEDNARGLRFYRSYDVTVEQTPACPEGHVVCRLDLASFESQLAVNPGSGV